MTQDLSRPSLEFEANAEFPLNSLRQDAASIRLPAAGQAGEALFVRRLEPSAALVVTKIRAGFDAASVEELIRLNRSIAAGREAPKYLVIDFAHERGEAQAAPGRFEEFVATTAELILDAPVITLAWARGPMAGADLDLALHCSMLVAQQGARFSFDGDPLAMLGVYSALARKIGFVRTERLIENGETLDAQDMRQMCLAREVVPTEAGNAPIEAFLRRCERRYNASRAIFRAERLAAPLFDRSGARGG